MFITNFIESEEDPKKGLKYFMKCFNPFFGFSSDTKIIRTMCNKNNKNNRNRKANTKA